MHRRPTERHQLALDVVHVERGASPGDRLQVDQVLGPAEGELEHAQVLGGEEGKLVVAPSERVADAPLFDFGVARDARTRSSIFTKLVPVLGEDDANTLMSEFPVSEADELVTKQFLRAELAELRGDLRTEMAVLGGDLRAEMQQQTIRMAGALGGATAFLAALGLFT